MGSLAVVLLFALGAGTQEAAPRPGPAAKAGDVRPGSHEAITALQRRLDRAVARVSLPHAVRLLGRDGARSFRLPGYGLVLVLAPRTLPVEGRLVYRLRGGPARVEWTSRRDEAAAHDAPAELESVERHVLVLQQETEQTRSEAERELERIVSTLRVRHGAHEGGEAGATAESTPNAAPAATPVATPGQGPASEPALPPPPPWKFWFEGGTPRDERAPDAVVADVKQALVEALSQGGRLPGLQPDESLAVAVDFEPLGLLMAAGPTRSLVVRARVRDLDARARGALSVEELRRRLEVSEY